MNLIRRSLFVLLFGTTLSGILWFSGCVGKNPEAITSIFFRGEGDNGGGQTISGKNIQFSRHEVIADNNADGIINPGETVYLRVYLKNMGTSQANSVTASISTTSSYISGVTPTTYVSYSTISGGGNEKSGNYGSTYNNSGSYVSYTVRFTVSSSTPTGTSITFNINIRDAENNTWTDTFGITVMATGASIQFSRHEVIADNNADGIINPGERVYLRVYLKNMGTSQANSVTASISTTSSYISGVTPTTYVSYGTISGGGNEKSGNYGSTYNNSGSYVSYTVRFTVSSSTPTGTSITFKINIRDAENNTWTDTLLINVQ